MQTIYKDEDEGGGSRRTDLVGIIIYTRKISRCLEGECLGGVGRRRIRIQICRGVFSSHQEEVWRRGGEVSKGSRIKKIRAERKDNGGVCLRV